MPRFINMSSVIEYKNLRDFKADLAKIKYDEERPWGDGDWNANYDPLNERTSKKYTHKYVSYRFKGKEVARKCDTTGWITKRALGIKNDPRWRFSDRQRQLATLCDEFCRALRANGVKRGAGSVSKITGWGSGNLNVSPLQFPHPVYYRASPNSDFNQGKGGFRVSIYGGGKAEVKRALASAKVVAKRMTLTPRIQIKDHKEPWHGFSVYIS